MEKIKVGEYYRTSNGKIYKWSKGRTYYGKNKDIVKHSKNIIDLIEVGDYVNGYKIEEDIDGNLRTYINETCPAKWGYIESIKIKTIVTREKFADMEYKIETEEK